jgi:Tol biopolymer transport system component
VRRLSLLTLITLVMAGCAGSNAPETKATGTIAFVRSGVGGSNARLWVMRADGSGQRALTHDRADHGSPAWSPDGRRIVAYASRGRHGGSQIVVIDADGSGQRRLTKTDNDYEQDSDAVWSPDGRTIAFTAYDCGSYWVRIVGADGSGQRTLAPRGRSEFPEYAEPAWSPDGRKILFANVHDGVYVVNRDGSGWRVLARMKPADPNPVGGSVAWSPDGRRIAFISDGNLWEMNADGTRRRRLVESAGSSGIAWSPDGRKIAFNRRPDAGDDRAVFVVNADGSGLRNLAGNSGVNDANPVWSPDGRVIAFTSDRDGNAEIYVMDADGSNQRNVSQNPADDWDPAWSPR